MCGIAGFASFGKHDRREAAVRLQRMTESLVHRGPDASGAYVSDHVALGHRRLSIIDLEGGSQPMSVLDGAVQIVFNGEIYNFRELRTDLEAAGHSFRTNSDTEVILHAYLEWGEALLSRLNGMFAFAIWDDRYRILMLARDRVGKKPLYIERIGNDIRFASELKALRAAFDDPRQLDAEALDCYLTMGYIPTPRTIFRGVHRLRAGHYLIVNGEGGSEKRYWRLSFGTQKKRAMPEALEEFEELLDDAVRCRLISDVPLGAFLSGGLDSSLVVSSMSRLSRAAVRTHSIGFDRAEYSELGAARQIARFLEAEHREFTVQPLDADVLTKIAWHCDEPFADSSALPTWFVCRETRASVTVALSGDGGDEAFGGYAFRYIPHVMESSLRARIPLPLRQILFGPLGRIWPASARLPRALRLKSIFENLCISDVQAFYRDLIWLRDAARRTVYRPEFLERLKGFTAMECVQPFYAHSDADDALGRSQFADINVYMTDDVLVKVDRMSMAHSLEVRAPLLDYRILEFAAGLPRELKTNMRQGKLLLRELASRRLPESIRSLPKRGFSIPAAAWLRGALREPVEQHVVAGNGIIEEFLDRTELRRLWRQHVEGRRDHSVFFWGLLMLDMWDRTVNNARPHGDAARDFGGAAAASE